VDDRRPEQDLATVHATLTAIERSVADTVPSRPVHGRL
jgi:hypothetical protein